MSLMTLGVGVGLTVCVCDSVSGAGMARPAGSDDINFVELERELRAAIEQDQRRAAQNDAKLRAVQQRVGTYDEFRWA